MPYCPEPIRDYAANEQSCECKLCSQFVLNEKGNLFQNIFSANNLHIIKKYKHFIWGVGLGQFVTGYSLLLPVRHILSFARLTQEESDELTNIMNEIEQVTLSVYNCSPIFFEHGCSDIPYSSAGSCISHAHMHFFPVQADICKGLNHLTKPVKIDAMEKLKEHVRADEPYALFGRRKQEIYLYKNIYSVQSQFMRMLLFNEVQSDKSWDWRNYVGINEMRETSRRYEKMLKGSKN